ncbi:mersacidin/lichenicidin family type 2 lantibiotic [Nostoc sp. FACHB-892]
MSSLDIIRAWKDEDYRLSLSDSQRALLPDSPVGLVELVGYRYEHACRRGG